MALDLNYEALVLTSTEGMPEAEWLEWRKKGIGGSDAGAVLGVSPYKTVRDVYCEKIGRVPDVTEEGLCVASDGSEYHVTYKPVQRTGINKDNLQKMMLNDNEVYRKYVTTTESRAFQVKKIEHKGA